MNKKLKYFAIILWAVISIYALINHEIWRDEMRALSIVIENTSIWSLVHDLKNEGHPILWYLVLKLGYYIYPNTIILKIISWLIGFTTVVILFKNSKLPIWLLISFAFSQILLWENTVMCRNYGISSLLLFGFLYYYRKYSFIGIVINLALLMQTNALSLIAAWLLFGIVCYDYLKKKKLLDKKLIFYALLLLCFSTLLVYITTKPDTTSIVGRIKDKDFLNMILAGFKSFVFPDCIFRAIIGESAILNVLLFLGLAICLIQRKILLLSFWILVAVTQFVNTEVYNLFTRHLGVVFSFFIVLLDIGNVYSPKENILNKVSPKNLGRYIIVPIIFIGFNASAFLNIKKDIFLPISSNKELGTFINNNPKYKYSVIIADADFIVEGLPYYIDHLIFKVRENKFGRYIQFTTKNKNEITILELLKLGDKFSSVTKSPTLFVCNQKFNPVKDTLYKYPCYTQTKFMLFDSNSIKRIKNIREFNLSYEDENYTLYELK